MPPDALQIEPLEPTILECRVIWSICATNKTDNANGLIVSKDHFNEYHPLNGKQAEGVIISLIIAFEKTPTPNKTSPLLV